MPAPATLRATADCQVQAERAGTVQLPSRKLIAVCIGPNSWQKWEQSQQQQAPPQVGDDDLDKLTADQMSFYRLIDRPLPAPMDRAAYHRIAGEVVNLMAEGTEACPESLLSQFLVGFGNIVGRNLPLKAEELRDCADTSVDIACGLGEKVYVAGLSAGGTMAAWVAQNRSDVTRVLLIAPALGLPLLETLRFQWVMALLLPRIPDIRTEWYYRSAPTHTYLGVPSGTLGQMLRLSKATFAGALHQAPKVQDVALVTVEGDEAVSNLVTSRLIGLWQKKGLAHFASKEFPKTMNIEHDMIDPSQKNQQTDIVYPVLVKLLNAPLQRTLRSHTIWPYRPKAL